MANSRPSYYLSMVRPSGRRTYANVEIRLVAGGHYPQILALEAPFTVTQERMLSKPPIVSMISLNLHSPRGTDVLRIMLILKGGITRLVCC